MVKTLQITSVRTAVGETSTGQCVYVYRSRTSTFMTVCRNSHKKHVKVCL